MAYLVTVLREDGEGVCRGVRIDEESFERLLSPAILLASGFPKMAGWEIKVTAPSGADWTFRMGSLEGVEQAG